MRDRATEFDREVTDTHVTTASHTKRVGKRAVFSEEQTDALKRALEEYALREGDPSDIELAKRINAHARDGEQVTSQQSLNRVRNDLGGFDYRTASALVSLLGYDGVDEFFDMHGVRGPRDAYPNRYFATKLAKHIPGVREDVLRDIVKFDVKGADAWSAMTWVEQIRKLSAERADEDAAKLRKQAERAEEPSRSRRRSS